MSCLSLNPRPLSGPYGFAFAWLALMLSAVTIMGMAAFIAGIETYDIIFPAVYAVTMTLWISVAAVAGHHWSWLNRCLNGVARCFSPAQEEPLRL